ncbi:MAG TPA: PaaX family transcriptional regulator C-terminal domain-containing protein [Anaerolineales bacterium]|nr:PaaX family transcriptional regulator C-terminal domain-containing protein [Anaerolineales bacterium]
MSKRPHLRTQFIIIILFGDVVAPRGGRVWTASLLRMLKVLGVGERAARSTFSRLRRQGWFRPERDGRHSLYTLAPKGRRILEEGGQRIFEPRKMEWDSQWHMVVYSLPESKRQLRNDLRKRLAWLGFGRLAPGTWISANNRREEVQKLLDDLDAGEYAQMFSGVRLSIGDDREIVKRCWDLENLNRQYARFIARWEPEYEKCMHALVRGEELSAAQCFAQRFWITHEYSPFPRLDPNLPAPLLPHGWLGAKAAELFKEYRSLLNERSNEFIESTMRGPNGWKGF